MKGEIVGVDEWILKLEGYLGACCREDTGVQGCVGGIPPQGSGALTLYIQDIEHCLGKSVPSIRRPLGHRRTDKAAVAGMERWVSSARIRLPVEWEERVGTERRGGGGGREEKYGKSASRRTRKAATRTVSAAKKW